MIFSLKWSTCFIDYLEDKINKTLFYHKWVVVEVFKIIFRKKIFENIMSFLRNRRKQNCDILMFQFVHAGYLNIQVHAS